MIKTQRSYIVITVFVLVNACLCRADLLDSYISDFIAKPDKVKVKSPVTVEDISESEVKKSKILREELKDSSIVTLPGIGGPGNDKKLENVLSQLKSLRFSDDAETVESEPKVEPQTETVVGKVESDANKVASDEKTKSQMSGEKAKPTVLLPEDTSEVVDSFELAESLFHIDDKVNALKFYRKAFKLSLPVDKRVNPRRAWILFQIGNSLYSIDNQAAIKIYEQLILEHPSSDWTNCARTKLMVLKWQLAEKPMALTMSEAK